MITGKVVFRAQVTEEGIVDSVQILKVPAQDMDFEEAVEKAVKAWKFEPARVNGTPNLSTYVGSVNFSLYPTEERSIREMVKQAESAWNKGTINAIADLLNSDVHIHSIDSLAKGPTEVESWFAEQLSGAYEGSRLALTVDKIHFLASAGAQVDLSFEITRVFVPEGEEMPLSEGRVNANMIQKGDAWLVTHGLKEGGPIHHRTWDIDPVPVYEPKPGYPPLASEKLSRGEVILEILVHKDGSTEVLRVLKSLPYGCVDAAIEAARQWRFKPALKKGRPVDAVGIITVEFDLASKK